MYTKEEFTKRAREVHRDKYDYSKADYKGSQVKLCIICPEHGEFWQIPSAHLRGDGCPKCANKRRGSKWTLDDFIDNALKVHGLKYNYSKVEYINSETKVCIICPEHGEFWQTPTHHLFEKCGCPKCAGRNLGRDEIIEKFKEVHGDRYDYVKVDFKKMHEKVCIVCPEHGEFWQTPSKHLLGQGCPRCGKMSMVEKNTLTREEFIEKAMQVHKGEYDYSKVDYRGKGEKIEIVCPKHGSFYQFPFDHLDGHGCPKCSSLISNDEFDIYHHICELIGSENVVLRDRSVIGDGKEIDIYIPSLKIGIEYNGLYWHSEEKGKGRNYHLRKTEECEKKGIRLIQVFEDEYKGNEGLVLKKIDYILGIGKHLGKIMGRKVDVKEINRKDAEMFLNRNHIQGYGKASISLGAFNGDSLIGVMSFERMKVNGEWNLVRFATDVDYVCQGVGGKLFSYFIKRYNPTVVKTFADRRWTTNCSDNLYTKLGFKLDVVLKPDYRYVDISNPKGRIHKFNLRKKTLHRKYGLDMDMTESEMVKIIGLTKIWDCGLYRYVWKKNESFQ